MREFIPKLYLRNVTATELLQRVDALLDAPLGEGESA